MARMTPRERVLAALHHTQPDRVPFAWGFGPTPEMTSVLTEYMKKEGVKWSKIRQATDDVLAVSPRYQGPKPEPSTDIWGIRRRSTSYGAGAYDEIAFYPLAGVSEVSEIAAYPWPDPKVFDYPHFRADILDADPDYLKAHKLNIDVCGNPLEIYCWMTGLEEALMNMITNPAIVRAALEHINGYFGAKLQYALKDTADLVDLLYYADDLGGQTNLLISRKTYREVLMPFHSELITTGKRLAQHASAMLHTDGTVFDILPELLEAGVEVLEAVQTDARGMQPQHLKQTYGDRLCFHGGISVQALLPLADETTVFEECINLVQTFSSNGGYIAAPSHAIQVGTPPHNVLAMLRTVLGEDDFNEAMAKATIRRV
jgi:uroporphyrinogen decarboxylase